MSQDLTEDAVARSREFVHCFWNGDIKRMHEMLATGFTWIGAQEEQFCFDAKLFESTCAAINEVMPRAILMNETYEPLFHDGDLYAVAGQYLGYTSPELSMVFAARQRTTMVWRKVDDELKLAHWHMSNPLKLSRGDEVFPVGYAQETYRYVTVMSNQHSYRNMSRVRDVCGTVHMLRLLDVVYLEANKQSTVVHCLSRVFRVREGIGTLAKTLMGEDGRGLVCVHRSYYVNALYVEEIEGDALTLAGGTRIPMSIRRHVEACEEIERARQAAE